MNDRLQSNFESVQSKIADSAQRTGRVRRDIRLVAVTKYVDAATAGQLVQLGCEDLGESRPQELWEKCAVLSDPEIRWHMVGPLQRNKIRKTLPLVSLIHSIDSFRLAESINRIAQELHRSIDVLVEINVSSEATKQGLSPTHLESALIQMAALSSLNVCGLMCMSGLQSNASQKHRQFAELRRLRDEMQRRAPQAENLCELSMGMSDDFEMAIAEGATMVRLGSILWDGV